MINCKFINIKTEFNSFNITHLDLLFFYQNHFVLGIVN